MKKLFLVLIMFVGVIFVASADEVKFSDDLVTEFYHQYNYQYEVFTDTCETQTIIMSEFCGLLSYDGEVIVRSMKELSVEELNTIVGTDFEDSPYLIWAKNYDNTENSWYY